MSLIRKRGWVQALSALGINIYLPAWLKGQIYQGPTKGVCVPVLNCYSCPSAVGACPIGAIQTFMASLRFNVSHAQVQLGIYVLGFLGAVGAFVGRLTCGWACPFGWLQELMYKLPVKKIRLPRFFALGKFVFLAVMVFLLPLLIVDEYGFGQTWFCKWVCPDGTLVAGLPLVLLNPDLRSLVGFMFKWKFAILVLFLGLMAVSKRPFCRAVCPLGAFLGLFNKASLFRMAVDDEKCTLCKRCQRDCPVDIGIYASPNSPSCIRCLKCVDSCAYGAISYGFPHKPRVPAQGAVPEPGPGETKA